MKKWIYRYFVTLLSVTLILWAVFTLLAFAITGSFYFTRCLSGAYGVAIIPCLWATIEAKKEGES